MRLLLVRHPALIPNKTVIRDVLYRDGAPTENDFTPFNGLRSEIDRQLPELTKYMSFDELVDRFNEYDVHKSRPNDEDKDTRGSYEDITNYHTRLENISDDYILKHVQECVVGFKKNNKQGIREFNKEFMKTVRTKYDEEEGRTVSEAEWMCIQKSSDIGDMQEAKASLNYCLKMLHMGSLDYKGSILSMIIAFEKASEKRTDGRAPMPKAIINEGVYRMKFDGSGIDLDSPFVESDNSKRYFPQLKSLVDGSDTSNEYYKVYLKLKKALSYLDIDILELDIKDYADQDFRKLKVDYIESNGEYFNYAKDIDPILRKALDPDVLVSKTLSNIASSLSGDFGNEEVYGRDLLLEKAMIELSGFRADRLSEATALPLSVYVGYTDELLRLATTGKTRRPASYSDYPISSHVLHKKDRTMPISIQEKMFNPYCNNMDKIYFTDFGVAFKIPDSFEDVDYYYVIEIEDMLNYMKRGYEYAWSKRSLL